MRKTRASAANKRLSGWCRAFIVLFVLFFAAGFAFLGSFRSTGEALSYTSEGTPVAVYNLEKTEDQSRLAAVYINVGKIYIQPGEDVTVTVRRATTANSKPSLSVGSVTLGNIWAKDSSAREGANFNWVPVAVDKNLSAVSVSVEANADVEIDEIVCIADDGNLIPMSVNADLSQGFSGRRAELEKAIDAQDSFVLSDSSYHNFAPEEIWSLTSVRTVLEGSSFLEDRAYLADTDFNSLATVLMIPSVALFGTSPFALRLPAFLAACACLVFVYLLGALLFRDDKYGFVFAFLFAVCGLTATLGRLGAPYMFVTCALVASVYFMYRFFARGISSRHVVRGGLNIFFSGLFAAFALAMNSLSVFPVLGVLVLFGFGMRRQKLAYKNEILKAASRAAAPAPSASAVSPSPEGGEGAPESVPADAEGGAPAVPAVSAETLAAGASSIGLIGGNSAKIKANYAYKTRVSWAFAALSFLLCTFVLLLLSSLVTYSAYVKAFDNPSSPSMSYAALLWQGISSSFNVTNVTEYTNANELNPLAWFLPLKAATLYDGVGEIASSRYLAWNASMNAAVGIASLVAFAFSTIGVVSELFSQNRGSRLNRRIRRVYLVLLGGMLLSLLSALCVARVSALYSSLFSVFYMGFIPLAVRIGQPEEVRLRADGRPKTSAADVLLGVCLFVFAVFFLLSVPSWYGFGLPTRAAEYLFGWMSIADNGYFRP